MRRIAVSEIEREIERLCYQACTCLPADVVAALERAYRREQNHLARFMLAQILDNARLAADTGWPLCQDTGLVVVFLEIGQEVSLVEGDLLERVNCAVRKAYQRGSFRSSIVKHPLNRVNTGDNTPAVIHTDVVSGDSVKITVLPKGFGSENMSRAYMLNPTADAGEIIELIVTTVKEAGGNPCPPVLVGVGIGGTMDYAALLAKKALVRNLDQRNPDFLLADMEREAAKRINQLGIGPLGVGGETTALGVHINAYPTHIAGLPVVINLQCHSARRASVVI